MMLAGLLFGCFVTCVYLGGITLYQLYQLDEDVDGIMKELNDEDSNL